MLILYIFNADVASAYGITNANPQFGKGGLPQYYVPDVQDLIDKGILIPVDKISREEINNARYLQWIFKNIR